MSRPDFWRGEIPWVSAKDMKTFRLYDTEDHVTPLGILRGTRTAPSGSILMLVRGMTLHNDLPICMAMKDMAFNQDVKAIVPKPGIRGDYLAYWFLANKSRLMTLVDSSSHGTGRIHGDALKAVEILIPQPSEQQAVAGVLSVLDDKIELNRRMNQTLEAMARAIFKSWFVDFDSVEGGQALEPSPVGPIPWNWRLSAIGAEVTVVGGATPSTARPDYWGGRYRFVTPRDMAGLLDPILLETERTITEDGLNEIGSGLLEPGTVLLSSRAPIGYLAITEIPVAINQGFIAMVCDRELPNYYVLQWIRHNMETIIGNANGTTFLEISKRNFRPIEVLVPPRKILEDFAELVGPMYKKMAANLRESRSLVAIRDSLLPKLLSGEIRVKQAEKIVGEVV
jgi:type I restriction enzyme S subunit